MHTSQPMKRVLLNSKLHRLRVTQVEIDYEGSCALDTQFMEAAKMTEYEKVEIYNVTNGERFSTYLIAAEAGSKTVSINGAAAHKASPEDIIIICSYGTIIIVHAGYFAQLFSHITSSVFVRFSQFCGIS